MKNDEQVSDGIIAYALTKSFQFDPETQFVIKPAPRKRKWMDETGWKDERGRPTPPHAYKCLPLVIANQLGWTIGCPVGFTAWWDGRNRASGGAVRFEFDENPNLWSTKILDRFGVGTFTLPIPYIFKTPPDVQLMTRGPTNSWKTNCQSLDAVMETDWLPYPFFQTWKIKRPNEPVSFNKGEPYAMVHPITVGPIKEWSFNVCDVDTNPELEKEYQTWSTRRTEFQSKLYNPETKKKHIKEHGDWQKDYSKGRFSDGSKPENHYSTLGKREVSKCPFSQLWRKDDEGQSQDDS